VNGSCSIGDVRVLAEEQDVFNHEAEDHGQPHTSRQSRRAEPTGEGGIDGDQKHRIPQHRAMVLTPGE
jgi:hypothetical protein